MKREMKSSSKIVIVGGGFAGASTAWWLRYYGETDLLLIERETSPGLQASGQNAAMARQATADPFMSRLLAEGVRFLGSPPKEFRAPRPLLRRMGSALMGSADQVRKLSEVLVRVIPNDEFEVGEPSHRLSSFSYLAGIRSPAMLYTKSDGTVDLESLLMGFLNGVEVVTSCEFKSAERQGEGWTVQTSQGPIRCSSLVIASGAWAVSCASGAGASVLPIRPTTRHLFQSVRQAEFEKDGPFVWDISTECYVRPDGTGALLLSACDEDPYDPSTPLLPSARIPAILREKLSRSFPGLSRLRFQRYWLGTRNLTPDGRFLIGPDPKAENLFWVAGLGGHGVTTSPAVGRMAAESILGLKPPPPELSPARFDPGRRPEPAQRS